MLAVGGLVLGDLDPLIVRMATRYRERFAAELGATCCGLLYEEADAPGALGSCSVVVERTARILLRLLAQQRSER